MRGCQPQNMPPLPCLTVHQGGAGEGLCPRHMGFPLPSPSKGPGLLSLLSSRDQLWWAGAGVGQGVALPFPREATEECLHAKQNVTPSPTLSQPLHGLSAHPAPIHSPTPPHTLEAAVMIRSGRRREVAITPLKSLWTFLSVALDCSSFGGEGGAQALAGRAGEKSAGQWASGEGLSRRQIVSTEEDAEALEDAGNLLRVAPLDRAAPASLRAKLALSQLLWLPLPRARDGRRKNFHCPEVNRQR